MAGCWSSKRDSSVILCKMFRNHVIVNVKRAAYSSVLQLQYSNVITQDDVT